VRWRDRRLVFHQLKVAGGSSAPWTASGAVAQLARVRLDEASTHELGLMVGELVAQRIGGGCAAPEATIRIDVTLLPRAVHVELPHPGGVASCEVAQPARPRRH
jgi:hypothetical protein